LPQQVANVLRVVELLAQSQRGAFHREQIVRLGREDFQVIEFEEG